MILILTTILTLEAGELSNGGDVQETYPEIQRRDLPALYAQILRIMQKIVGKF